MKRTSLFKKGCAACVMLLLLLTLFSGCNYNIPETYITNDVADYLYYPTQSYKWTSFFTYQWSHDEAEKFIPLVFPQKIEDYFSDVEYHLFAYDSATFGMEMALEFTIEDEELFDTYIQQVLDGRETKPFPYDDNFEEYVICEYLTIFECEHEKDHGGGYDIYYSQIGKLLINKKDQRVIFYTMYSDGSEYYMNTGNSWLFERFKLDPKEYKVYTFPNDYPTKNECYEKAIFPAKNIALDYIDEPMDSMISLIQSLLSLCLYSVLF